MWGWIVGGVLLGVLALAVLLLLVPVEVALRAARVDGRGEARGEVRWLFGLVRRELHRGAPRERAPGPTLRVGDVLATEGFLDALARLIGRSWRALRVRVARLRLHVGGRDPAETGMLLGALAPLYAVAGVLPGARLELAPDFEAERLDGEADLEARAIPLRLVAAAAAFSVTPAVWRAWRAGRRGA